VERRASSPATTEPLPTSENKFTSSPVLAYHSCFFLRSTHVQADFSYLLPLVLCDARSLLVSRPAMTRETTSLLSRSITCRSADQSRRTAPSLHRRRYDSRLRRPSRQRITQMAILGFDDCVVHRIDCADKAGVTAGSDWAKSWTDAVTCAWRWGQRSATGSGSPEKGRHSP